MKKNGPNDVDYIYFYFIDTFHMKKYKHNKSLKTRKKNTRLKDAKTSIYETFNSWIRPINFFLDSLRPQSHKFWMEKNLPLLKYYLAFPSSYHFPALHGPITLIFDIYLYPIYIYIKYALTCIRSGSHSDSLIFIAWVS